AEQLKSLEASYRSIVAKEQQIKEKTASFSDLNTNLNDYREFIELLNVSGFSILEKCAGRIPTDHVPLLEQSIAKIPHLLFPVQRDQEWTMVLLFALKKDISAVQSTLRDLRFDPNFPEESLFKGTPQEVLEKIQQDREKIAQDLEQLETVRQKFAEQAKKVLPRYAREVHFQSLLLESRQYFKKTARTCVMTGWVPSERVDSIRQEVARITQNTGFIQVVEPAAGSMPKLEVPYQFRNNILLKPFELVVKAYGIPTHGTIDPTPLFAISFMLMFGFMFGDVGDGLVFSLLGLFLALKKKVKVTTRHIGLLLMYCGIVSMVFGFLYGSIFGVEDFLPALWLHPMHNVMTLLTGGLYFGIIMISCGIVINIVNGIRTRDWTRAIFDKAGLLGGLIYWGAVGLIFKTYFLGHSTPGWLWALLIGLPILLLFFKAPFEKSVLKKRHHDEPLGTYLMEMFFEVIEIFMGYLSNTVSFIRVGAFALSHAGLFVAIFSLVDMVRNSTMGGVWAAIILIFGNLLVLVLEGMVVTIQAIRLEYYEFFSKFYTTGGKLYTPIKIDDDL
ncbi:hypothetical protein KDK77_03945, partial [bacterium]|nr:hypothetical protein [bacterium]